MRVTILISLFLVLAAGCVFHHDEATDQQDKPATRPVATSAPPTATAPPVDDEVTPPEEQSELIVDEEGRANWKEIKLPQGWPENVPLVEDARIVYRERAIHKVGLENYIVMESQVPVDEAGSFYMHYFTGLGWQRLDTSRDPQLYNCTFLNEGQIIDVNVRHVPEDRPEMEGVEVVGEQTDFEGTVIKIDIMPAGDLSYFKGAVAWYSLDDVPPGYPLDEVPRFPGGVIDMASFAPGDHVVMQQHIPGVERDEMVDFYRDFYLGQELAMTVTLDDAENYVAEFTCEDYFVRVSATRYADAEMGYCDIYKQFTAAE